MVIHISVHRPAVLADSYPAAPQGTRLGRSVVRHRTRTGLAAWTGLAAGVVSAGAMLGLPVQNVDSTACACPGGPASAIGIPQGGELTGTPRRDFVAGSGLEHCSERRASFTLSCRNFDADRLIGGV